MILNIVLLVVLLLAVSLVLFFLGCILVPAVKEQTRISDNMMFATFEYDAGDDAEEADVPSELRAVVLCSCDKEFARPADVRLVRGLSCSAVHLTYGSVNDCTFSCIGMGDCADVCAQKAISIRNGTAVVSALCNGCGRCVSACPKGVIRMVSAEQARAVLCCNPGGAATSCSCSKKEGNIERALQKHFKIWQSCYRMLKGSR